MKRVKKITEALVYLFTYVYSVEYVIASWEERQLDPKRQIQ